MVESGLKELGATLLAAVCIIAVADFVFLNASTGRWFAPKLGPGGSSMTTGYAPATQTSPGQGGLPDPVTC